MHVNFEEKTEAARSFFLRKTKSELPVSGWSTQTGGEREGEKEGGAHSHIGCAASSGGLCGTPRPNMGFTFLTVCVKWLERIEVYGEKNFQSGIKYRRVRKVQTSPSVCVRRWERESRLLLETQPSTLLGHTGTLRQRKLHAEYSHIDLGWVFWMTRTPFSNHGQYVWKVWLVTLIRSSVVEKLG